MVNGVFVLTKCQIESANKVMRIEVNKAFHLYNPSCIAYWLSIENNLTFPRSDKGAFHFNM